MICLDVGVVLPFVHGEVTVQGSSQEAGLQLWSRAGFIMLSGERSRCKTMQCTGGADINMGRKLEGNRHRPLRGPGDNGSGKQEKDQTSKHESGLLPLQRWEN